MNNLFQKLVQWMKAFRLGRERKRGPAMCGHSVLDFTEEQRQVIALDSGRHLVLAPPGTGKTELLAQRMLWAVAHGVDPARMICLTFTIRAARNMEERIASRIHAHLPFAVGNVHHFCAALLFERQLVPRAWTVIDEPTQREFLNEVIADLPREDRDRLAGPEGEVPVGELLKICCVLRQQQLRFPAEIVGDLRLNRLYQSHRPAIERIHQAFRAHKEAFKVVDFDDLLNYAYAFVVQQNRLVDAEKFLWVQVDEVQDLSPIQWAIITAIQAPGAHCVYLGDLEQAVFSFMGASLPYLAGIAHGCRIHNLQKNFRSPSYLLDVFVKYALANLDPQWQSQPVSVVTRPPANDDLLMLAVDGTVEDEVERVLAFLQSRTQTGKEHRQTAVLVRDNKSADAFAAAFDAHRIPVFKISGFDLMCTATMMNIKAYCSTLVNREDRLAWARMFRLFGRIATQRNARTLVRELYEAAIRPPDLMQPFHATLPVTASFAQAVESGRVVVFDTETTGLDTACDDILQIAAVEYLRGVKGRTFEVFLQTDRPLEASGGVHHITRAHLDACGVAPAEGLKRFCDFAAGAVWAAHNLKYDLTILKRNLERRGVEFDWNTVTATDTLDLARRLHPGLKSYKLADLIASFSLAGSNTHNALDDVLATGLLMLRLRDDSVAMRDRQLAFFQRHAQELNRFIGGYQPLWERFQERLDVETSYRDEIGHLAGALQHQGLSEDDAAAAEPGEALLAPLEKFLKYTDVAFGRRPAGNLFCETREPVGRLKESDLILGNETFIVSTIHKAKGLEFDCVVIPKCIDDVYPHYFSKRAANAGEAVAEDARLLYVAMTRAKRQLVISWPTRRNNRAPRREDKKTGLPMPGANDCQPSPFLKPIMPSFSVRVT
jgi:DNA helicase-2/ATP-dependent DNA helicase PcrA